jgi:hypothetical protein
MQRKAAAEAQLQAAVHEYNGPITALVQAIKAEDAALRSREVPAEVLAREAAVWAPEEQRLRDAIREAESALAEQRRSSTAALQLAEQEAVQAEGALHAARMARSADEGTTPFRFDSATVAQFPELFLASERRVLRVLPQQRHAGDKSSVNAAAASSDAAAPVQ